MRIVSIHSHKGGRESTPRRWPKEWREVQRAIRKVDLSSTRTKVSKEKTMVGRTLYSPKAINKALRKELERLGWSRRRIQMKTEVDLEGVPAEIRTAYKPQHKGFREIDFVKNRLGIEVQFGKYAFMVYNVLAKMTIFHNRDIIDAGIEIVPMRRLALEMSTGVSYFEQMKADLETRGTAELDIPVVVLGVDADSP